MPTKPGIYRWLPRSLERQLMLMTAICLVASILGYGAYTAKNQTTLARQTITAQMAALAQNIATIGAYFIITNDLAGIEGIALQTATVPGIFSVLVTDVGGKPLSEVVNNKGQWSPRFSTVNVTVPAVINPVIHTETKGVGASQMDFLAGDEGTIAAWHPIQAGTHLGWVRVSYRLDSFKQTARDIWTQALLVIALAIGATLCLLKLLLRPPMRALHAATRFAGELDHAMGEKMTVSTRAVEMEALGQALNTVSQRLFTQNRDLSNQKFALDQHAIVSITDLNGDITYANDLFCDISGYSQQELIGQSHRIVNSGYHPREFFAELWQTISRGEVWRGEVKNRKKDGSPYWVNATIVPMLGADGLPLQYVGIRTDITAIKNLEHSLQAATLKAETANKAKSDFLANMSHEIRTPMNGVIGMTELALETQLNTTQRSYLNTVMSSAQSLMVILNDILDFSKIEAGKLTVEHIAMDIGQVVSDALTSIEARATKKGLTLIRDLPAEVPELLGDPGRIRQVLTNLCDNAIKFTQHGSLTVSLGLTGSRTLGYEAHVSVADTGLGIAQDKQQLIFAAFSQADTSTTRQFGGTGLGLSISARLVELMGGRIWLESQPGQGSTFHFTVLLETASENARPAETEPGLAPPSRTVSPHQLRILVVEDHPVNQLLARVLLEQWGHTVALANNGQQAVDLFPTAPWDIVLMDMQMPVMGGIEATRLIRAMEPVGSRTPIIAVTANALDTDREVCLQAGMDAHLSKPIKSVALRSLLEKYCQIGPRPL